MLEQLSSWRGVLAPAAVPGPQLAAVLDWMSCVLDSSPQSFVLDPKMVQLVSSLSRQVKTELAHAKLLAEIGIAADVAKYRLIPAVSAKDQSQLYSIEFLSLAD